MSCIKMFSVGHEGFPVKSAERQRRALSRPRLVALLREADVKITTKGTGGPQYIPESQIGICSVKLDDVFYEINKRFEELQKRFIIAVTQLTSAGAAITMLAPLSQLIEPLSNTFLNDFSGASQFIDSDSLKLIRNTKNAIIFSFQDRQH